MHAENIQGLDILELNWLLDHHATKATHRQRVVDDLNLQPGDVVIDLGCGPGLWSTMLAEKVAPHGKVIGIDYDARYIEYAHQHVKDHSLASLIEFRHGGFEDMTIEGECYDFIFSSGCSPYIKKILPFLKKQQGIVKPGGRIADRSWDDGLFIFHPIDLALTTKVISGIAQARIDRPDSEYFDNYFGRQSNGLFKQLGLHAVESRSYAVQLVAPLSPVAKRYITGNARWYATVTAPYLSAIEHQQWLSHFDVGSPNYILNSPDFYYAMLEVLTIGTVAPAETNAETKESH